MLKAFRAFMHAQQLLPDRGRVLLAVSGGIDSVVMSKLFHQAKLPFAIAHCNFALRGRASAEDATWVRALARQYGAVFYTQAFDVPTHARAKGQSIQMAARELRHAWFEQLCVENDLAKVATAHHGNDSLETVLLHLTKGTGLAGLHGILPAQGRCIRPLLFADKADIIRYAQAEKLTWRADRSNHQDTYQRNLLRNQVIPQLRKINPSLETTFRLTAERLGQVERLFNERLATIRQQLCHQQGPCHYIAVQALQDKPWGPVVVWEWLKPFGFHFAPLKKLLTHPARSGAVLQTATHRLHVDRGQWIVTPGTPPSSQAHKIEATTKTLPLPHHTLQCTHLPREQYTIMPSKQVAALDRAKLQFPLLARPWQPGDAFCPLGMRHRKKLSDFLIDNKVPCPLKAAVWVVTNQTEIVWVMGHRLDERFKITPSTQHVYEMQLHPAPSHPTAEKPANAPATMVGVRE